MRNIFVRFASFIWVVAMPQTFAQLELPLLLRLRLRRALFNLILFSHSPQSFNLHSHVSISKFCLLMCIGVCGCVCVCERVCGQTVCGTWLWIRTLLEQRLEAPQAASSAAAAVATKRRGYTPLPRPQVAYGNCLCDLLTPPPAPCPLSPLALSHLAVN